ncbi:TonB-dependent receptor plug domain-containing protein [Sphingomonas xanthus]|uniref:TonB-dependent receptor n=1 Tax=Sphingomonas xanthus TaxID=2594473 RepID=A0A516IRU7_9SPHN|nr:TonB-dependent receptor plug domain-containing protein [Sphingomonas xanthus]QDP19638.1 TonB-dependent receptor [Sphingomonas xanthus]
MSEVSTFISILLASTAPVAAAAQEAAPGSQAGSPAEPRSIDPLTGEEGEEIVVVGQKPRGSVIGDIPAENVLDSRDIRSTGATSINELLAAVASQTGSARGRASGRPILLLNGQRVSGFRELRDLPPEAIERMEILPEEVALKYGYAADQRVVNIVLRRRFNSTTAEVRGQSATSGDYAGGQADATRLLISEGQRTSVNLHVEGNTALYEDERAIALDPVAPDTDAVDPRPFRTLVGARQNVRLTGAANRMILGDVSATFNGEVEKEHSRSHFGVPTGTLDDDGDEIVRAVEDSRLTRETTTEAIRLGSALNGMAGKWRWSSTANAELSRTKGHTERGLDLAAQQDRLDANDPTFDPRGDLGPVSLFPDDHSRAIRRSLTADGTLTGPVLKLPAGDANMTLKAALGSADLESRATRRGQLSESDLGRDSGEASISLDLPITRRSSSIGRLSANANFGLFQLSDFGTLTNVGAGLNWSPAERLNVNASWTREEGAPTLQQLGDPLVDTPGVAFFDYRRGETVFLTTQTGGNPDLDADRRNVFKVGGNWQPFQETDLRLRAEYVWQAIDRPQGSFPAASEALEDAFPDRFERDPDGRLVRVDLTPVNFLKSRRETLRWGLNFTKTLQTAPPSPETINALRSQFAARRAASGQTAPERTAPPVATGATPPPSAEGSERPAASPPSGARDGGPRFGGGGGGGPFGRGRGGRLTLSFTHQLNLVDEVAIAKGLPKLDYLDGEAVGTTGGRPNHELQVEAGYYNNGLGARLQGNWRSGTRVESSAGDLRFSPYADIDLRFFANLGERLDLVAKHPFLRGSSVRLDIDNLFDARPKVRDANGSTPLRYQPALLEPIGRTVSITFRKLFIPVRFFQRGGGGRRPD